MPSFVSNECNKDIVVKIKTSGHESEHRFVEFLKGEAEKYTIQIAHWSDLRPPVRTASGSDPV